MARNYNAALGVAGVTLLSAFITGCSTDSSPRAATPSKSGATYCETVPTVTILLDQAAENDLKANKVSQANLEKFLGSSAVPTAIRIDPSTHAETSQNVLNSQVASELAAALDLPEGKVTLTNHGVASVPPNEIAIHVFAKECFGGSSAAQ